MNIPLLLLSILLHGAALFLTLKVVKKYEQNLTSLKALRSFNPFCYSSVRLWTILLTLVVSMGFLLISMQLLVAKGLTITLHYLLLDVGAAILNLNYLILFLLEKRGVHSHVF